MHMYKEVLLPLLLLLLLLIASRKVPKNGFYWLVLGHMTISEPVRVAKRMSYSDWLILGLLLFLQVGTVSSEYREREEGSGKLLLLTELCKQKCLLIIFFFPNISESAEKGIELFG